MLTIKPIAIGRQGKKVRFRTLVSTIERSGLARDLHEKHICVADLTATYTFLLCNEFRRQNPSTNVN